MYHIADRIESAAEYGRALGGVPQGSSQATRAPAKRARESSEAGIQASRRSVNRQADRLIGEEDREMDTL